MFLHEKITDINQKLKVLGNMSNIVVWGGQEHIRLSFLKKQGKFFFGFHIKNPWDMIWDNIDAVIISAPAQEQQIAQTLIEEIGYKGKIVSLYNPHECTPFYLLYEESVSEICYMGDYAKWEEADRECEGYNDTVILDKVSNSMKKVINGKAVWERDGYLFYKQKYVYRICAAILKCAIQNNNQGVRVLDIGGSLGSTYFQNRTYWKDVKNLEYIVAEQNTFAEYGHKNLENKVLKFIKSQDDYKSLGRLDLVIMSASLQYIAGYQEIIKKIMSVMPRYIILDRIMVSDRERICKESVPKEIYLSSYPVFIFTENQITNFFEPVYEMIEEDISSVPEVAYFSDGRADSKYYVFQMVEENKNL